MTTEDILMEYPEQVFYTPEGFDDAVVGIDESSMRLVYSVNRCMDILIQSGFNRLDAIEFFELNIRANNPPDGVIFIQTDFSV